MTQNLHFPETAVFTIHEAANILGLSTKTLRRFEERGVLVPARSDGGHRRYTFKQLQAFQHAQNEKKKQEMYAQALDVVPSASHIIPMAAPPPAVAQAPPEPEFVESIPQLYSSLHREQKSILRTSIRVLFLAIAVGLLAKVVPFFYTRARDIDAALPSQAQMLAVLPASLRPTTQADLQSGQVLGDTTFLQNLQFKINVPSVFKLTTEFLDSVGIGGNASVSGSTTLNGGLIAKGAINLQPSSRTENAGDINLTAGHQYLINGVPVVGGTTLGTAVKNSSLTSVGALNAGSISGGFGAISTGNTITGAIINANNTFQTGGTTRIDNSGNLTNIGSITTSGPITDGGALTSGAITGNGTLTVSGAVTFSNLASGIVHSSGGLLSSSAVNLSSSDVTNVLPIANGGTNGTATPTAGGIAYGTGSAYAFTPTGTSGTCFISNGTSAPSWANCSAAASNYWSSTNGALYPVNSTFDFFVGGTSTASAKFAILNASSGTPTATLSGTAGALDFTATGTIATTNNQSLTIGDGNTGNLYINPSGNIGVGTTSPSSFFSVGKTTQLQIDNTGKIVAAQGITSSGSIIFSGLNTVGGVVYTNGSGTLSQTGTSNSSQCLLGGATPSWGSCAGAAATDWLINAGSIYPGNSTLDLFVGGTSTASAKFAFINNNSGTPTATIAGSVAGNALSVNGDGTIATSLNRTLALNPNGGNVNIGSSVQVNTAGAVSGVTGYTQSSGNFGISGSGTFGTGTGAISLNGNTTLTGSTTLTINALNANGGVLYTNGSGTLSQTGTSSSTQCLIGGTTPSWSNCSAAASNYWTLSSGALYPVNATTDLFVGGTSTTSAKFAFINNNSGTPTATIAGSVAGNALSVNGDGIIATSLNRTLALNPNGGNVNIGSSVQVNTAGAVSGVTGYTQSSGNFGISGSGTFGTGTGAISLNGNTTLTGSTTLTINALNTNGGVIYTNGSGTLNETGTSSSSQCLIGGTTPTWSNCSAAASNYWTLASGALYPVNATTDLFVGGTSTTSAKFAFINNNSGTPTATIAGSVAGNALSVNGDGTIATSLNRTLALNPNGGNVTVGSSFQVNNAGAVSGVTGYTQSSGNVSISGSGTFGTGTGAVSLNGNTTVTGSNTLTIAALNTAGGVLWTNSSGTVGVTGQGQANQCLTSGGSAIPTWQNCAAVSGGGYLRLFSGALSPVNDTADFLIGNQATASAKFAFINVNSGTPTASISAGVNGATYLNATGVLATTAKQSLTLGDANTGNIVLNNLTTAGGVLFTNSSGTLSQTGTSNSTQCLIGGTTPTWSSCSGASTNYWTLASGALYPVNATTDLFVGGTSTASAKFAFINNNSGTPTATIAGSVAGNALSVNGDGTIATSLNRTLALNPSGGNVTVGSSFQINNAGALSGITGYTQTSGNFSISGSGTFGTGTGAISLNGNTTLTGSTTLTINALNTNGGVLFTNSSGTLNETGTSSSTQCLIGGTTPTWSSCSAAASNYWTLASGALYPVNSTTDLFVGGTSTASAKFAFINNNSGTPTATIAGSVAGNALSLNGDGTIATSLNRTLALNPNGGNVTVGSSLQVNNAGALSGVTGYTQSSGNFSISGSGTFGTGTGAISLNGNTTLTGSTTLTINALNTNGGVLFTNSSGTLNETGTSSSTQCLIGGTTPTWSSCSAAASNYWTLASGALYPVNATTDLFVGGTSTASAKFAFINNNSGAPTATIAGSVAGNTLSVNGDGTIATSLNRTLALNPNGGNVNIGPVAQVNSSGAITAATTTNTINGLIISSGALSGITGHTQTSGNFSISGSGTFGTGTGAISLNGNTTLTGSTTLTINALNTNGGVLFTNSSGTLNETGTSTSTQCLTGGTTPTWSSCSSSANNLWTSTLGSLYPVNSTMDLFVGGTSTAAAKFAFINNNSGTPTATIAGSVAGNALSVNGDGTISTSLNRSLALNPNGGFVGIGTSTPQATLDVSGTASISSTLTMGNGAPIRPAYGDLILQAKTGGNTWSSAVDLQQGTGNVGIGNTNPSSMLSVGASTQFQVNSVGAVVAAQGITSAGTIQFSNLASCLGFTSNASGNLQCSANGSGGIWQISNGVLSPGNSTLDVGIGGTSTTSAKFAFENVNSGTPTASISGSVAGNGLYLTGDGTISTTLNRSLALNPNGGFVGVGTSSPANLFTVVGPTGSSGQTPILDTSNDSWGNGFGVGNSSSGGLWQFYTGGTSNGVTGSKGFYMFDNADNATRFAITSAGAMGFGGNITNSSMNGAQMVLLSGGNFGVGNTNPSSLFSVGSSSQFQVNSSGAVAAATGVTSSGTIQFSNLTSCLGFTSNSSGTLQCSANGSGGIWQINSGFISPGNSTLDLGIGGTSTTSAKFAFINVNSGTPTASISGSVAGNALSFNGDGTISTSLNRSLLLNPNGGDVGVGTSTTLATLDVRAVSGTAPVASVSGKTSMAAEVVDQSGVGDIFTASVSGLTKFTVNNAGNVNIANLNISGAIHYVANTSGQIGETAQGISGECLVSGGSSAPTWGSCNVGNGMYTNNTTVANGSYVQVAHNQNTNDLVATGWVYDASSSAWVNISSAHNGVNYGTGSDGAITITGSTNLNTTALGSRTYADSIAYKVSSAPSGTSIVTTDTPNGLAAGDELLLIDMEGTNADYSAVGTYEFVKVSSVNTGTKTITTTTNIQGSYSGSSFSNQSVIIQRVPNYTDVTVNSGGTITASAWDGLTTTPTGAAGYHTGIVMFRANDQIINNGTITASSLGFRGAAAAGGQAAGANGETYNAVNGTNGGTGGQPGNQYCIEGGGAGGGAYNGSGNGGTRNGCNVSGVLAGAAGGGGYSGYSDVSLTKIYLGSAGGAGGGGYATAGGAGGNGGGVIFLAAPIITNGNSITNNGATGGTGGAGSGGGGGGGAGGAIYFVANSLSAGAGTVSASGGGSGTGGNSNSGGAGANGWIISTTSIISGHSSAPTIQITTYYSQTPYVIQEVDTNNVRLYNYSGVSQNLRLDVAIGNAYANTYVALAPTAASVDSGTGTNSIWINKTGTGGSLLKLQQAGTDILDVQQNGGLAAMTVNQQLSGDIFSASASGSPKFTINNTGTVGIGTVSPATALQVVGDIRVGTSGTNGCIQNFAGTGLVGTCSSDARLKTNIQPFSGNILSSILALQPVTYNWDPNTTSQFHFDPTVTNYGLIAQQVEQYIPQLVDDNSLGGYKAVNYSLLPMYLLEGLKEEGQQVSTLSAELNQLTASVSAMTAQSTTPTASPSPSPITVAPQPVPTPAPTATASGLLSSLSATQSAALVQQSLNSIQMSASDIQLDVTAMTASKYIETGMAYVGGTLGVQNDVVIGRGLSITDNSIDFTSALPNESLSLVKGLLTLNPQGFATINGDLTVNGRVTVTDTDAGGYAVIPVGAQSVTVSFKRPFTQPPIVTATAVDFNGSYSIHQNSNTSFTISIAIAAPTPVQFNWIALAVANAQTTTGSVAGVATSAADIVPSPTPTPIATSSASTASGSATLP